MKSEIELKALLEFSKQYYLDLKNGLKNDMSIEECLCVIQTLENVLEEDKNNP